MMRLRVLTLGGAMVIAGGLAAGSSESQTQSTAITGRVVWAATGQPIVGARVGSNVADVVFSAATDAQGRYELRAPVSARLVVRVGIPGYPSQAYAEDPGLGPLIIKVMPAGATTGVDFFIQRGGTITGRVMDDRKEPVVKATVLAYQDRWWFGERQFTAMSIVGNRVETDDRGDYRYSGLPPGEYVIGVIDRSATTFAPSGISLKGARRLAVAPGQELTDVNVQTGGGSSGSITGQLIGRDPASPDSRVWLTPEAAEVSTPLRPSELTGGGQYRFDDVAPGRYWLIAWPAPAPSQTKTWARESVVVAAGAETTRELTLSEGATIAGRVSNYNRYVREISLNPFDRHHPEARAMRVVVGTDGSFRVVGIAPGRYRWLRTQEALYQLSVFEGESPLDIADLPFTVHAGDALRQLRVEVTSGAIISGTVTDRDGKPTTAGGVIIAATDPGYWTGVSRRLLVTRADQFGFFEASRLPAGEYFVAHVTQLGPGQLWDPAFLKKTLAAAQRVTVTAGGEQTVNLRLK
jgi:hypothetical protein